MLWCSRVTWVQSRVTWVQSRCGAVASRDCTHAHVTAPMRRLFVSTPVTKGTPPGKISSSLIHKTRSQSRFCPVEVTN
eukprot:1132005-Rhodomonas_salina.1